MGSDLLVCVPNVSEGSRGEVIAELRGAAEAGGAVVCDIHSDVDHGRSVFTIIGSKDPVGDAVHGLAQVAIEQIDLRKHTGVHPRFGALDVVPFVQTEGGPDVRPLALKVASALADDFALPVFLYGVVADGRSLPDVRKHAFKEIQPDFGPREPHATAGAVALGVRAPLVAFNVNLATDEIGIVKSIAADLREKGGGLPHVRALGLKLASVGLVQVSCNLTEPLITTIADVFDEISRLAEQSNVRILNSELVGLAPMGAFGGRNAVSLGLGDAKVLEEELEKLSSR